MKALLIALSLGFASVSVVDAAPAIGGESTVENDSFDHGGGCRKSSPPGQCCHMDRKTGVVHCH